MTTNENKPDSAKGPAGKGLSEEDRAHLRRRTNARIAHWCSFFALVIILIDFAAYVIGRADAFFTTAGVMLSIALLAIAMLNNPTNSSR